MILSFCFRILFVIESTVFFVDLCLFIFCLIESTKFK